MAEYFRFLFFGLSENFLLLHGISPKNSKYSHNFSWFCLSLIIEYIGRAAAHAAIFPLIIRRKELSPVCRHIKRKKVAMRWFVSIALGSSAGYIRQYTLLTGTCNTVRSSIKKDNGSACAEKENRYMLVRTRSKDIPM